MYRVIAPPKTPAEISKFAIDVSGKLTGSLTVSAASVACSTYSGVTTSVPVPTASVVGNTVTVTFTGGVLGCIYSVVVTVTISDGSTIPFTYYQAVVPDLP